MAGPGPNNATPSVRFAASTTSEAPGDKQHTSIRPTGANNIQPGRNDATNMPCSTTAAAAAATAHLQLDATSQTYASLIQQYLSVLCHDNATFYAERMVAHDPTLVSIYLLATCHYRSGNVKRARCVLLERGVGMLPGSSGDGNGNDDGAEVGNDDIGGGSAVQSASVYLLAQCCSDLRLYSEAEDVLLRPCRDVYNRTGGGNAATDGASGGGSQDDDFDDWFLTTSPCPMPNGAAGLALLGLVCRRSDRPSRAAKYFRMSLKLDPMMWTSYEALCEMGAANTDVDDPTAVFGVVPASLKLEDVSTASIDPANDENDGDNNNVTGTSTSSPSFISMGASLGVVGGGAPTPMSLDGGGGVGVGSGGVAASMGGRGGTSAARGGSINAPAGPFETPDLTPIQRRDGGGRGAGHQYATRSRQKRTVGGSLASGGHPASASAARGQHRDSAIARRTPMTGDEDVVARARTVASRLYYAPSPETTPPHVLGSGLDHGSAIKAPPSIKASWSATKSGKKGRRDRSSPPLLAGLGTELDYSYASSSVIDGGGDNRGRLSFGSSGASSVQTQLGERRLFAADAGGDEKDQSFADGSVNNAAGEMPPPAPRPPASAGRTKDDAELYDEEEECGTGEDGGVQEILELLCLLGAAQRRLCEYKCRDALRVYYKLPHSQFYTGFVQHQIGRAYFEMSDYQNAQKALETMQRTEPHRMQGLEVLSTALWHLKKEVELSNLAQRAIDFDRQSAEAWCVVGNCFSLQKEHETALTFFRRSVRLDPSFTYSHTLSGHEYVASEDFEKAAACYRDALRADDRHYNAWYGLGAIYFRQEKHDLAEYHFRKALTINPQSSVLRCHLGMAQHATGKAMEALDTLAGALLLDPRNPQARYQRATIWMAMDRPEEALAELERVRDAAPKEASVHFAMGRVLKRLGKPEGAMRCFLTALDLDPKDNNLIKAAMDRLDEPDVDEDVSEY